MQGKLKTKFFQLILMGGKERTVQHLYWILALRRVNGLMQRVQQAGATSVKEDYRKSVPRKWQISFQLHLFEPLCHMCQYLWLRVVRAQQWFGRMITNQISTEDAC